MFVNRISDKKLKLKIYKEIKQLNRKEHDPVKKRAKDMKRHFSKEDMHMGNRYIKKLSIAITWETQVKTN